MFCKHCGASLDPNDKYCQYCGQATDVQQKAACYCKNCGNALSEGVTVCPKCNTSIFAAPAYDPNRTRYDQGNTGYTYNGRQNPDDSGSFGWFILGFIIPIVGIILWIIWMKDKPKCSRMSGLGALVSIILGFFFPILLILPAVFLIC